MLQTLEFDTYTECILLEHSIVVSGTVELWVHTRELGECEQVLTTEVQSEVLYMDLLHPFAWECITQGDVL